MSPSSGEPTDEAMDAALAALSEPGRLRAAELRVARFAPELQRVLAGALQEGGWFDEAHDQNLRRVAAAESEEDRITALRTLLAEETRLGMLVGVAIGWELARELEGGVAEGAPGVAGTAHPLAADSADASRRAANDAAAGLESGG